MALAPKGMKKISTLSAAKGLDDTTAIPTRARVALIQAETQNIRWRDDGTDPTASIGILLAAGDSMMYEGPLSKFRFIETTASATVNVSFYG